MWLDAPEGGVRRGGELDCDWRLGFYRAAVEDDAHDACSRKFLTVGAAAEDSPHQVRTEAVHLDAGCAQTCELDDGSGSQMEAGRVGQGEEFEVRDSDVLAQLTGGKQEAEGPKVLEEAGLQEVNLSEVGLRRIATSEIAVLNRGTAVRVAAYAQAGQELDTAPRLLAEGVLWTEAYGDNAWLLHRGVNVRE